VGEPIFLCEREPIQRGTASGVAIDNIADVLHVAANAAAIYVTGDS
jgi:hypothetical protein